MQKLFYGERKDIVIKVDKNFITFFFKEDLERNKDTDAFYWFHTDEWKYSRDHWEEHLSRKSWYTDEMTEFLDDTTSQL